MAADRMTETAFAKVQGIRRPAGFFSELKRLGKAGGKLTLAEWRQLHESYLNRPVIG